MDNAPISNLILFVIFHTLGYEHYGRINTRDYEDDRVISFRVLSKSFSMLFRIVYGILQIPGVSLKVNYENGESLYVNNQIKL